MKRDPQQVIEIILDELAQVLHLSPVLVDRCRQQVAELMRPRWPALFLATGDEPPDEATAGAFRTLTALGIEPHLARSHSFAEAWPLQSLRARLGAVTLLDKLDVAEISRLPDRFPLLCVLTLSSNTVVKTVLGLRDALPPRVLRAFLERGRPVVVAGIPPQRLAFDQDATVFWNLPLAMRQWLFEGYRTLEQWGVQFVKPERVPEVVRRRLFGAPSPQSPSPPQGGAGILPVREEVGGTGILPVQKPRSAANDLAKRTFLTLDDVRAARARGEHQVMVAPNTLVTDEAREFAARWGILLVI